ncbi:MAG: response regulator [Phycisphaerales bacterium]|nr:response regulator [Phycisphaerales bacterium]
MKIMLVDDSRTIRNIQKNILGQLGHTEIVEAADGVEAMKTLESVEPDLMLLDWNMPNMDGLTLLKTLREKGRKFPIIMCTTEAEKSRVIAAIQAGASNYVVKPFSTETLAEKIAQTVKRAAAAPAPA